MSEPQNINARFRTYSYHHILIVAADTPTAETLASDGAILLNQKGSTSENLQGSGGAFYLINGLVDSHFVIKSVWWESIKGSGAQSHTTNASTLAGLDELGGEMVIEEPAGVDFLNTCVQIARELGTPPVDQTWLLKTIFIGYTDAGTQEILGDTAPIFLNVVDLVADIKSTGTTYAIQFVSVRNGTSHLSRNDTQYSGMGTTPEPNSTIGAVVQKAETEFNEQQRKEYQERENLRREKDPTGLPLRVPRDVQITVHPDLENVPFGDNTEKRNQDTGQNDPAVKSAPSQGFLDTILHNIGTKSAAVVEGRIGTPQPGMKPLLHMESQGNAKSKEGKPIIDYQLTIKYTPVENPDPNAPFVPPPAESTKRFYYVFTGRNTDIKDLDLKLSLGAQLLQIAGNASGQQNQVNTASPALPTGLSATAGTPPGTGALLTTPLANEAGGGSIRGSSNFKNPGPTDEYFSILRRAIALSKIEVKLTIIGDPIFLNETNILPSQAKALALGQTTSSNTLSSNPVTIPTFAQLIIKYPARTADYNEFALLYDGYYTILQIKNMFDGGEFTQELLMLAVPGQSGIEGIAAASNQETAGSSQPTSDTGGTPTGTPGVTEQYSGPTNFGGTTTTGKFSSKEDFYRKMYPIAEKIAPRLGGVDPALLVAQWQLEAGGRNGPGNHQPRNDDGSISHNVSGLTASGRYKGKKTKTRASDSGYSFRSYNSYEEFGDGYVAFIRHPGSHLYDGAIAAAERGDDIGYLKGLLAKGFGGNHSASYVNSVNKTFKSGEIQRVAAQLNAEQNQVAAQTPAQTASEATTQNQTERAATNAGGLTVEKRLAGVAQRQNSPPAPIIPER